MTEYISRGARLFPDVGGRICVFLIAIGMIIYLPMQFLHFEDQGSPLFWFVEFTSFVLFVIFGLFSQTVILLILRSHFFGECLPFPSAIENAWRLFPRILRAWFIPAIFIFLGYLMCIIPGIYLIFRYYFITHEIVFCDAKAEEEKQRSETDTEGWKGRLFAFNILLFALPIIVLTGLDFYINGFPTAAREMQSENILREIALQFFWILFYAPFETLLYITGAFIFYENSVTMQTQNEEVVEYPQE